MFKRLRFTYTVPIDEALARLDATVAATPDFGLAVDGRGRVRIFRRGGFALLNGFFPVFVGSFQPGTDGTELQGGFRFHLLAIGVFAGFVAVSALSLAKLLLLTDPAATLPADWKSQRIRFELQFIGFACLSALFAWLAGKPMRERIADVIMLSARNKTPA
jgi:hypothetical protein